MTYKLNQLTLFYAIDNSCLEILSKKLLKKKCIDEININMFDKNEYIYLENNTLLFLYPEYQKHPFVIRLMTREIVNLLKTFKVIIITHNDYIVRELNTLTMLNEDSEKINNILNQYKSQGYTKRNRLDFKLMSIYEITKDIDDKLKYHKCKGDSKGTEVKSIDECLHEFIQIQDNLYYDE